MSAVPLKLQISGKTKNLPLSDSDKSYAVYGAGTERFYSRREPFSFFQLGSYRIRLGISGSHRLPKNRLPLSLEILRLYALRHRYWVYCIADGGFCQG